ncbi:hypothetical protein ACWDR2_09275 [Streptomyces sp. NPDC003631]|jgi:hypothetical protein|uniref:FXSXX-COOH protein n=1 Tax=Streptomyces lannensis TaxID=766498 RepID=A0ABP7JUW0_9ACTN|nr:hypothetical protein [Streptomyces sp. WAC07094]TFV32006.1 hypothetical protein E4K10_13520 [Streptomyces sp. T1317-0309]
MNSTATKIQHESVEPRPVRRLTPLASTAADKTSAVRSTSRLTDAEGWRSKKPIAFDAAL